VARGVARANGTDLGRVEPRAGAAAKAQVTGVARGVAPRWRIQRREPGARARPRGRARDDPGLDAVAVEIFGD